MNKYLPEIAHKTPYNSKMEKHLEEFIYLRIEGKSFDDIATELKTTKQTLIEWNKKTIIRDAINEGKIIKINSLVKTYNFDLQERLTTYLKLSKKINDELLSRDLVEVSTETLLKMSIANDTRLKDIVNKKVQIGTGSMILELGIDDDGYFIMQMDE